MKSTEQFIKEAKSIHGDKYDYSSTVYTGKDKHIIVKCNRCGKLLTTLTPHNHLKKDQPRGCRDCNIKKYYYHSKLEHLTICKKNNLLTAKDYKEFIKSYNKNNKKQLYGYLALKKNFGDWQVFRKLTTGEKFISMSMSKGERIITKFLWDRNIDFTPEYPLQGLHDNTLFIDFLVNINGATWAIEFDGSQHSDKDHFFYNQTNKDRDKIKDQYFGKKLVRINENDDIESILITKLNITDLSHPIVRKLDWTDGFSTIDQILSYPITKNAKASAIILLRDKLYLDITNEEIQKKTGSMHVGRIEKNHFKLGEITKLGKVSVQKKNQEIQKDTIIEMYKSGSRFTDILREIEKIDFNQIGKSRDRRWIVVDVLKQYKSTICI